MQHFKTLNAAKCCSNRILDLLIHINVTMFQTVLNGIGNGKVMLWKGPIEHYSEFLCRYAILY